MTRFTKPFAVVDVETTGCNPLRDRIIEIAVIRLDGAGEFVSLVNPDRNLSPFITGLTGIADGDLAGAPRFEDIAAELADLLEGAVFVAHNARFDYGFVRNEFKRIGISFVAPTLCTVRLSRKLYPRERRHGLESIIARHALDVADRHRALADARAVADFLECARGEMGVACYDEAVAKLLKTPTVPAGVAEELVRDLPNGPGVYLFYGPSKEILYVGKSINIRDRVLSHFAGDHGSAKESALCRQVVHVEARPTAGELSALLLESSLVKEHAPVYNRRLRASKKPLQAVLTVTPAGYETVTLQGAGDAGDHGEILAQYRSRKQAREQLALLAKLHGLCAKLLQLEHGPGACFARQMQRCQGACCGLEDPVVYNRRFRQAFAVHGADCWPYGAPVLVSETCDDGTGVAFVIDQWRIRATVDFDDVGGYRIRTDSFPNDTDTRSIVRSCLANPHASLRVRSLTPHELAQLTD